MIEQRLKHLPFITSSSEIDTICKPLNDLGISSYVYLRTYNDFSEIRLGNRTDWLLHYYKSDLYKESVLEKDPTSYSSGSILWSSLTSHSKVLDSAKNDFNIANGITVINKSDEHTEMTFFGGDVGKPELINLYVSDPDILINFNRYFKEKAAPIIKKGEKNRIKLPRNLDLTTEQEHDLNLIRQNQYLQSAAQQFKQTLLFNPSLTAMLSKRELQIVKLLPTGATADEISKQLFLSRRTIEAHLASIKKKLNVRNKTELIRVLLEY
jgi:DNA-binding CsgD family transcriptional regulator